MTPRIEKGAKEYVLTLPVYGRYGQFTHATVSWDSPAAVEDRKRRREYQRSKAKANGWGRKRASSR